MFLGLITNDKETDNIKELTSVYKDFDGLAVSYHGEKNECWEVLNERKGDGFVIHNEYFTHHAHAMNQFLFHPKIIPYLTWIVLRDSSERLNPKFSAELRNIIRQCEQQNINAISNYSKILAFRVEEGQCFHGSPHWGLGGFSARVYPYDKSGFPEIEYAYSVRNNRPEDHFIAHFLKYYLYDHSNHMLLGNENNKEQFLKDETARLQYKVFCRTTLNINPLSVESLLNFWKTQSLTEDHKKFINQSQILNDAYNYLIKGIDFKTIKSNHDNKITLDI